MASREYLAVVHGVPAGESGTIVGAIGRHPVDRKKYAVVSSENGRYACTHWSLQERLGDYSLLRFKLDTGRTHQIRRHLAEVGHPLVGEDEHAAPGVDPATAPRYSGQGLFLCAISMALPEGDHGPAAAVHATPPSKYRRIRWVADALEKHGFS